MADLNTFEWEDVEVRVPKIDGYTFLGYDDCTKNLPCYWFDFTDRKLVEARESEYPFYAMLYVENMDKCVQGGVETTATNIRVGDGHVMSVGSSAIGVVNYFTSVSVGGGDGTD